VAGEWQTTSATGPLPLCICINEGRRGVHTARRPLIQDDDGKTRARGPEGPRPCSTQLQAVLPLALSIVAALISATTIAPISTAARLLVAASSPATISVPAATLPTPAARAEVTASLPAATLGDLGLYVISVGFPRPDEAKRGGHQGSAGELYHSTPRDGAGIQTRRQIVEGVIDPFFSPHQQRNSSFSGPAS
jgi:hypothetical protein